MQSLVNLLYGIAVGVGLYFLGVPYPLVWAALGAALRFIPYVGPVLGAGAPILVSLAALQGWTGPLWVVGLFVVLELFTNLVLETVLYAGAAGVSQVALLVSVAFWTWLWGPLGLLMATPLTVCLVVLGKHVPGLEFVGMLMADTPALAPEYGYYQRLLARDQSEAAELIERHIKTEPPRSVYDALLLPALNYAERDRLEQRLSLGRRNGGHRCDAGAAVGRGGVDPPPRSPEPSARARRSPAPRTARAAARAGLRGQRRRRRSWRSRCSPICWTICRSPWRSPGRACRRRNWCRWCREREFSVVCFADLPPSPPSKTRYLVKRLRAALPEVRILVGRWAPPALADESTQVLRDAGANLVASTLVETRAYLGGLVEIPRIPVPETIRWRVAASPLSAMAYTQIPGRTVQRDSVRRTGRRCMFSTAQTLVHVCSMLWWVEEEETASSPCYRQREEPAYEMERLRCCTP